MNALDGLGQTGLHRCAREGNTQACRILMAYGVDPSIVSLQGYSAFQVAAEGVQKILHGKAVFNKEMLAERVASSSVELNSIYSRSCIYRT